MDFNCSFFGVHTVFITHRAKVCILFIYNYLQYISNTCKPVKFYTLFYTALYTLTVYSFFKASAGLVRAVTMA